MDDEKHAEVIRLILDKVDFKSGIIQNISKDKQEIGCILDIKWKRNVHFVLYLNKWNGCFWYWSERNGEKVSPSHMWRKIDDSFLKSVQHIVHEIENGAYNTKRTINEQIAEIIQRRQLTSNMNNTKWIEFISAMNDEISIKPPYGYKALFDEDEDKLFFDRHYDRENFNGYHFKSIEWVMVKPKFYECKYRGRLIEDEKIYYDVEQEFIKLMKKYSIPYEYDDVKELYIIYGYK